MNEWYSDWLLNRGDVATSLADTLEQAIRGGRLAPGAQLPTHRDLSKRLGVAVSTVSRAYAEAARRGLIGGTVGRGTFVSPTERGSDIGSNREGLRPLERLYLPLMQREDAINLSLNEPLPDGTGERLREALVALAAKRDLDDLAHYQPPQGQLEHRAAGAVWLRELGVDVPADDVYAVSGGQTALMTIFLGLARPGETVLTEELTWPGALSVGRLTGIRLMPVSLDEEGLVPEAFDAACQTYRPRFVYTMPTLHNPTTATASLARRKEIVRIARAHNVLIVEDDAYGFLVEPRAIPYCQLARDITIYLTSLSKSIAPALRVGYMAVPPRLHKAMRAAMRATTAMVSPVLLELTTHLVNSGAGLDAIRFQTEAARRRQRLAASILGHAGPAPTSLHYWLRLPSDMRNAVFVADALASGVAVTPGDAFTVLPGHDPGGVRVCLCAESSQARVEQALTTLARLLHTEHAAALRIV
jgi:DNA-binding transcriptional MocR family regulator